MFALHFLLICTSFLLQEGFQTTYVDMREKQNKNKYLRKMEFIQKMSPLSSHLIKSECRFDRKPRKKIHLSTRFRRCVRLNLDNNQNAFLSRRIEVHYFPLEIRKNFFCRSLSRKTDTKINSALNNTFVAHFIGFFSGRYLTVENYLTPSRDSKQYF